MKCLNTYFSKKLNQEIDYEFLKLQYINGKSLRQIENEYGIGRAALSRHLKQDGVKILGNGELTKKLTVQANAFSASAKEKIEALGGKAEVI